ncbi:hypothetical protein PspLS_06302, partial [Pyricularia sp. CBS 133598]
MNASCQLALRTKRVRAPGVPNIFTVGHYPGGIIYERDDSVGIRIHPSLEKYTRRYDKTVGDKWEDNNRDPKQTHAIVSTWVVSFEQIRKSPGAVGMLSFFDNGSHRSREQKLQHAE